MKSAIIAIISLVVLVGGSLLLSLAQVSTTPTAQTAPGVLWLIPLSYFLMLAGAGGLAWGMIEKHRQ